MIKIKKALISVSDKSYVLELAKCLNSFDVEILSTGGTAKLLKENKIKVPKVFEEENFFSFFSSAIQAKFSLEKKAYLFLPDFAFTEEVL